MHPTAPTLARGYASAPSGQVHYYDSQAGEGIPLLMLHQSPTSSLDWANTFPAFAAAGQRVIAVDTPGMGMSDAPPSEPTIPDYVPASIAVLDQLGVERAHVIGHHTGAQIAAALAARHPDRVASLILYGVPVMTADELKGWWDQVVPREREGRLHKPEAGAAHIVDWYTRIEYFGPPATIHRMTITGLMAGPLWWYGHNAALTYDMSDDLKAVTAPILLLSNQGEMLHANTEAAHKLRPDAELITMRTDGSMAMDSDPQELADTVTAFLQRAS